jgi:hypothetical protein
MFKPSWWANEAMKHTNQTTQSFVPGLSRWTPEGVRDQGEQVTRGGGGSGGDVAGRRDSGAARMRYGNWCETQAKAAFFHKGTCSQIVDYKISTRISVRTTVKHAHLAA